MNIKALKYNRALGMNSIENKYMLYAQQHAILLKMDLRLKIATVVLHENGFDHTGKWGALMRGKRPPYSRMLQFPLDTHTHVCAHC